MTAVSTARAKHRSDLWSGSPVLSKATGPATAVTVVGPITQKQKDYWNAERYYQGNREHGSGPEALADTSDQSDQQGQRTPPQAAQAAGEDGSGGAGRDDRPEGKTEGARPPRRSRLHALERAEGAAGHLDRRPRHRREGCCCARHPSPPETEGRRCPVQTGAATGRQAESKARQAGRDRQ